MKLFSFGILALLGLITACTTAKTSSEECPGPSGQYVNTTVLSQCPEKMPADIPHFCLEIEFIGKDSVKVDNGFEKFTLRWSKAEDGCTFLIHGATLFGDMSFTISGDTALQLVDTAWTKLTSFSTFQKVNRADEKTGFETLLNECVLVEEYALFDNGNLVPGVVTFMANGQLNGFKPFIGYKLCYAGDCLEETIPPSRIIELIDQTGNREMFAFKNVEGKMAIELYQLSPPVPDVKGERSIGPMVYELRTE